LSATINEFPVPTASSGLDQITVGPDGNLWFTENRGNKIGEINPTSHAILEFPIPTPSSGPDGITAGPDGDLWFTEQDANKIGQINPTTHAIAEFPVPTANSSPQAITTGPGGDLWFTEKLGNKIGEINPTTHVINEFPLPTANSSPNGIAAGSDGNLWFTELAGRIGEINPDTHAIVEFPVPTAGDMPTEITLGPDGNLWFTVQTFSIAGSIGEINPTTHAINEFSVYVGQEPVAVTTGPDANLWFGVEIQSLANGAPQIGQINPTTHAINEFPTPTVTGFPSGITAGPDGNLWFPDGNSIDQAVLGAQATAPDLALSGSGPSSVAVGSDVTYHLTVTNNGAAGATGVTLSDTLPSGVTFVSATGGVTPASGVLDFSIGSLAAGASTSVTITVTATAAGMLTDSASTGMSLTDPTPADNSLTLPTDVRSRAAPDLALAGTVTGSGTVGTNVIYKLTATNTGTGSATGVRLVDTLPAGVKFVSATGGVRPVNGVLTFAVENLAAGAHTSFTIVVTPTAAGTPTDTASVSLNETDPTQGDNRVTLTTTIASVQRMGIHGQPTTLVLTFGTPVDAAWAQDTGNYHVVALGGSRRKIRFKSAVYDAATRTVTLRLVHRLNLHDLFRLTVVGPGTSGQTDASGHSPNSSKTTAERGSSFTAIISAADLVLTTTNPVILREYREILLDQSAQLKRL
jgi:virginiamycin B lyase